MKVTMAFMSEPLVSFIAVRASKTIALYLLKITKKQPKSLSISFSMSGKITIIIKKRTYVGWQGLFAKIENTIGLCQMVKVEGTCFHFNLIYNRPFLSFLIKTEILLSKTVTKWENKKPSKWKFYAIFTAIKSCI